MIHRSRRLRRTSAIRSLVRQIHPDPHNLVLPAFVVEGLSEPREIDAMPGVYQHTLDSIKQLAYRCAEAQIGGIDLFAIPAHRDAVGSQAHAPDGILNKAIAAVRSEVGDDLVVIADTCLDEFTDHGHCGVLDDRGYVLNDETNALYADMAVAQARAGAHMVSPSGMMDGQIAVIRQALDHEGFTDTAIIAYSAKYASGFYGPFREAVDSQLKGDRRTYQMDPANRDEALVEVSLDIDEGADVVMVKPAGYFLDIVRQVRDSVSVPVAAYQVSGEYSMIEAAAARGWIDHDRIVAESITSIFRAGADLIFTYWALQAAEWYAKGWTA